MAVLPPIPDDWASGDTPLADEENAVLANLRAAITGLGTAVPMPPAGHTVTSWTADPALCSVEMTLISGTVYLWRVYYPVSTPLNFVAFQTTTSGSGASTGCTAAIFTDSGTRLALSNDIASQFTGVGISIAALANTVTPDARSFGWIGLLWRGSSSPRIAAMPAAINTGTANIAARRVLSVAGQTIMPSGITIGSATLGTQIAFVTPYG